MAVEAWALDEVRTALQRARDEGRGMSRSELQQECGIGTNDLEETLDTLRERGEARQQDPDTFEAVLAEDRSSAARPAHEDAEEPVAEEPDEPELPPVRDRLAAARRERAQLAAEQRRGEELDAPRREVKLSHAMVESLQADALGELVKAGLEDGETFVLIVEP